jgi:hypothetical protein
LRLYFVVDAAPLVTVTVTMMSMVTIMMTTAMVEDFTSHP